MYIRFVFPDRHMPEEFGDDSNNSVYYNNGIKICASGREKEKSYLGSFSRVNLFVGANNSGKSRFLRGLLKSEKAMVQVSSSDQDLSYWLNEYDKWVKNKYNLTYRLSSQIGTVISQQFQRINIIKSEIKSSLNNIDRHIPTLEEIIQTKFVDELGRPRYKQSSVRGKEALEYKDELQNILELLRDEMIFQSKNRVSRTVYIPILRGLNRGTILSQDSFLKVVKELYDLNENQYQIFTGLDLFDQIKYVRNDIKEKRLGFEEFESFLSNNFFNGDDVEIISHLKNQVIQIYINEEERKIQDVGDGIQSLILLLFPIYTSADNTWIFIEEPETHLHPGLQRIFIETLLKDEFLKEKNLRYFFTTHSNHFLDLTIESKDMSIFQFEKINTNKYEIKTNVKPDNEILDVLGVNSSSVFLANTSIWIEGPTCKLPLKPNCLKVE